MDGWSKKLSLANIACLFSVWFAMQQTAFAQSGYYAYNSARLVGQFTIASGKAVELQHYIATARAIDGLGTYTNSGEVEVYAILECWKN